MSQHVSGHIGQSVSSEFGPFITIGNVRFRKSLVMGYSRCEITKPDQTKDYCVMVMSSIGHTQTKIQSMAEVDKEIEQLDWVFKKEYAE